MPTLSHVFNEDMGNYRALCSVPRCVTSPTSDDSEPCSECVKRAALIRLDYRRAYKERVARDSKPPTLVCDWCGEARTELRYLQHWPGHRDERGNYRDPLVCTDCCIKNFGSAEPPEEESK